MSEKVTNNVFLWKLITVLVHQLVCILSIVELEYFLALDRDIYGGDRLLGNYYFGCMRFVLSMRQCCMLHVYIPGEERRHVLSL